MTLPRLYAIADAGLLAQRGIDLIDFAGELAAAGTTLLQYRNKSGSARAILEDAARLKSLCAANSLQLILNDRADLALLARFDGVHVGQEDLSPADARRIVGADRVVGVSTHTPEQVTAADTTGCDYIAYGPIFGTATKENPDPVVGLDGLRQARSLTRKPLVAIGGITLENCRSVIDAGVDSVAIISALVPRHPGQSASRYVERFLSILT
jgi:thiamine-phosphate pyrophosphorylase